MKAIELYEQHIKNHPAWLMAGIDSNLREVTVLTKENTVIVDMKHFRPYSVPVLTATVKTWNNGRCWRVELYQAGEHHSHRMPTGTEKLIYTGGSETTQQ